MKDNRSLYEKLGVDPNKQNVREIFGKVVDNDFAKAFVNIVSDPINPGYFITQHQDGDGSKMIQRLLDYYENGDPRVFMGAVDDAFSMNSGDIAAAGFVFGPWIITDVLNLNLDKEIKEEFMKQIATGFVRMKKIYTDHGFEQIKFLGGETADLRDQVKSGVFDICITAWAKIGDIITGENIKPGDAIFGFRSDGKAIWEETNNSGLMSNGLTLARSCLMHKDYNEQYPGLRRDGDFYTGRFCVSDSPDILYEGKMNISDALMSPTRQWAIVIRKLIEVLKRKGFQKMLHGITMNTGGGATKIQHIGDGICYVKKMPDPSPIFKLIQKESGEEWRDMYKDFNCGVGIDIIGEDSIEFEQALREVSVVSKVTYLKMGNCKKSNSGKNQVMLNTPYGEFKY